MTTILLSVAFFTGLVLALVLVLLWAKAWLLPDGEVEIAMDGRTLRVASGQTLLAALSASGIFVPSGCGGRGTCGGCKVEVRAGNGALLPTERAHVRRAEERRGVRLACQMKVKRDVEIFLPPEILGARRVRCRVRSARNVATFIREIVLALPSGEEFRVRPGGYVQVECPPHTVRYADFAIEEEFRHAWDRFDLWRCVSRVDEPVARAYSVANHPGEKGIVMLNVRLAAPPPNHPDAPPGKVSSFLFGLREGDEVDIDGPFGEFFARDTSNEMVYVGGGAGMAPMRAHLLDLLEGRRTKRKISFWYGARSRHETFYTDLFDRLQREHENFTWNLVLSEPRPEDAWDGLVGFVHQVLFDRYLKDHPAPEDAEYYLCGPPLMILACRKLLDGLGVEPENVIFDDFS